MKKEKQIKENDVFNFRYKEEIVEQIKEPYWCFDGQLIARKYKGKILLVDTYWASENKQFTPKEAKEMGELTFKCNLNDIKKCSECDLVYYADKDIFNLSHQHGCYKDFYIKKDAKRNKEKMLTELHERMEKAKRDLEKIGREIESLSGKITKIKSGELGIYI